MKEIKKIKLKVYEIFYGKFFGFLYSQFGKGSYIIHPVLVTGKKYLKIAKDVCIWDNARIECINNWRGIPKLPQLHIGNHVSIGQGLHMTCAEQIVIEDNVTISSYVVITDISHSYENINVHQLKNDLITKPVSIGEYSLIGAGAKILPGVTIGKNCIIGANAVVTHAIPDYSIVAGIPAKVIKRYNFSIGKWEKVKDDE